MAEPARTRTHRDSAESPDEWDCTFIRYVEGPGGRIEERELPLTPEVFLDPKVGDTMVQGMPHIDAAAELFEMLKRHFAGRPDVLVLHDVKHLLGRRRGPAPDISVILGAEEIDRRSTSYNLAKYGIPPSFILEVVSPSDARIRRVDEVVKVELYARVGVREYFLQDLPRRANEWRGGLQGYRLDSEGRYQPLTPDPRGRLCSETLGLLFGISPEGDRVDLFLPSTGERLLRPLEVQEAYRRESEDRRRAEQARLKEEQARKTAEAEVARLRREIERLRRES